MAQQMQSRIAQLLRLRASIFSIPYADPAIRSDGTHILRERLVGPALRSYYPPDFDNVKLARRDPDVVSSSLELDDLALEKRKEKQAILEGRNKRIWHKVGVKISRAKAKESGGGKKKRR
ncbi:hypothetical protein M427DRAFT_68373 [Gonapodya prolifera JEL478]|uniref:Uncharacterized protein n=1 Tax=Gonapodya prolifera (strain JEL478) TaxID=1344416 RepID=A0A139AL85_GONPJ|nr:hypothetical protein M427DRAFT_68373 [Gonapodya prolifera JEL478]|eukprot:KXS17561.1 hypothetical protein M427DRAFT_68373 [Gonapodya prolifera JEL478]